jgi:hypothetical protein
MSRTSQNPIELDDLDKPIFGVDNIAPIVGLSRRQTFHALERGYLPGTKFGRKWVSTLRRLHNRFSEPESRGVESTAAEAVE